MLYLLNPDLSMKWLDLPGRMVLDLARKGDIDLNKVEWDPAERQGTHTTTRLALRYGVPVASGIAVDAIDLTHENRAHDMAVLLAKSIAGREKLDSADQLMEALAPGWTKSGDELNERVDQSVKRSIREAAQDLEKKLETPVDSELMGHWASVGGFIPPEDHQRS